MTLYNITAQVLGLAGIIASVMSFQCKKYQKLIFLRTANEFFFAIQYIMLGAYTGAAMNIVGSVRNYIFMKLEREEKNSNLAKYSFSAAFLIFSLFTWSGFKSILIAFAKVLSTFAYGNTNVFFVRCMIFLTSTSWLIYNFMVKSYAGCFCELLTLVSIIVGIIRIDIPNLLRKKAEN